MKLSNDEILELANALNAQYDILDNMCSPYRQDWCDVEDNELAKAISDILKEMAA